MIGSIPGGHPPAIILVPPLLALGVVGHVLFGLVTWLVRRGRVRRPTLWPAELVLIATVLGLLTVSMTAAAIAWYASSEGARESTAPWVAAAALHVAAFATLLRLSVARFLVAAVACGWAMALAIELLNANAGELPMALVVLAALLATAAYLLRSRRIREALA